MLAEIVFSVIPLLTPFQATCDSFIAALPCAVINTCHPARQGAAADSPHLPVPLPNIAIKAAAQFIQLCPIIITGMSLCRYGCDISGTVKCHLQPVHRRTYQFFPRSAPASSCTHCSVFLGVRLILLLKELYTLLADVNGPGTVKILRLTLASVTGPQSLG